MNNIVSIKTHLGILIINLDVVGIVDIMFDCGCIFIIHNNKMYRIKEEDYNELISMTKQIRGNSKSEEE